MTESFRGISIISTHSWSIHSEVWAFSNTQLVYIISELLHNQIFKKKKQFSKCTRSTRELNTLSHVYQAYATHTKEKRYCFQNLMEISAQVCSIRCKRIKKIKIYKQQQQQQPLSTKWSKGSAVRGEGTLIPPLYSPRNLITPSIQRNWILSSKQQLQSKQ